MNNKKIFHINDVANVGKLLVDGQRNLGYDSQLFNIKIPFAKQNGKDLQKYEKIKWIQFHEKLNRSDVIPFINTFNIIIGHFSYGIIGVAELESMSCKKPVISYFNYPNFYDEGPPILKTKDPHLIAEYIKGIIIDNKIIQVGEKCFNWLKENHEFNNIAKKITEYYDF